MCGAGASLAIAHTLRFATLPAPASVVYFELTLLPRALPNTPESVRRATNLYSAFENFGGSKDSAAELGLFSWHVTPDPGVGDWGTKVEVLGQYFGKIEECERVLSKFEDRLGDLGETNYKLGKRSMCTSSPQV